ncbi:MAG: sensor histidine kinase, partial [Deltaproteobacteria bacterium]|nr:sensor histidine kinase [Deltaproteobacteria bacterium]
VQECVSNAAKHAEATQLQVRLGWEPDRLLLTVKDDGKGFTPSASPAGHYGLRNMQERAGRFGGILVIDSAPGKGALVSLSLPVN